MEVSSNLKKQIIIEIVVLLLMASVAIYAYVAIDKNSNTSVINENGFVLVLDDSKFSKLLRKSDGEGLESDYVRYTITNNNSIVKNVKLIIEPSLDNDDVLSNIRIGVNDLYVNDFNQLEKTEDGYVVDTFDLLPGITRNYLFKYWYKLDTSDKLYEDDIHFSYDIKIDK